VVLGPGVEFGAYTVLREIGRGGMAVVYEAEHRGLQKRVALKVLHTPVGPAEQRFLREGLAAARIRHEHIVEVFDTGVHDGVAYLVMERLSGESLAALLRREGPLDGERAVDLLLPVVSALAAAHDVDVVHRDIKPENIHLSRSRRDEVVPKVVDFGLARLNTLDGDAQRLTGSAALLGTVTHLSPEQVLDPEAVSAASDQYALGVVMYECVTGRLPAQGASVFVTLNAILKARYAKPRAHAPALDPRLEDIIVRAMAREPRDRFASVRALGVALLPLASPAARSAWSREFGEAPAVTPPALSLPRRSPPARAWPVLLVALVAGAGWLGLRDRDAPHTTAVVSPARVPAASSAPPAAVLAPPAPPTASPPASPAARPNPPRRAPTTVARRPTTPTPPVVAPPVAPVVVAPPSAPPDASVAAAPWMLRTQY
jgi:serine/threonine-protein kinase